MHLHTHQHRRAASAAPPAFTHSLTPRNAHSATPRTDAGLSPRQPLRWRLATHFGCNTDTASQRHLLPRRSMLCRCPLFSPWGLQNVHEGAGTPRRRLAIRLVRLPRRAPDLSEGTTAPPTGPFIRPAASTGETGAHWASEGIKRAAYTPSSTTSRTTMSFKPASLHATTMARSCGAQAFAQANVLEVCHG